MTLHRKAYSDKQYSMLPVAKSYTTVSSFSWDQDTDKVKVRGYSDTAPQGAQ